MVIYPELVPLLPLLLSGIALPLTAILRIDEKLKRNIACIVACIAHAIAMILLFLPTGLVWVTQKEVIVRSFIKGSILSTLYVDSISTFFMLIFFLVGLIVSIYSWRGLEPGIRAELYYALICLLTTGMTVLCMVGDFISFFAAWELLSISIYALVCSKRDDVLAMEAAFKYMMLSCIAAILMIYGLSILYGYTGHFDFIGLQRALSASIPYTVHLALALLIITFCFKAAIVPFHTWAPDVYQASIDPITALLSGATTKAGVYGIMRLLSISRLSPELILSLGVLSVATMTIGNLSAILQRDIKRLLAYSSISHMGFVIMGFATLNPLGLAAALFHSLNHAIMKPLAFLSLGNMRLIAGDTTEEKLRGIGRRMPVTTMCLMVSLLSLMGIPGLNGFVSKFMLILAAFHAGLVWLAIAGIVNSAIA
ncbi:MAG: hypothetical protein DRM97_02275, partial [Thermoprotei archaeon]